MVFALSSTPNVAKYNFTQFISTWHFTGAILRWLEITRHYVNIAGRGTLLFVSLVGFVLLGFVCILPSSGTEFFAFICILLLWGHLGMSQSRQKFPVVAERSMAKSLTTKASICAKNAFGYMWIDYHWKICVQQFIMCLSTLHIRSSRVLFLKPLLYQID